MILSMPDQDVTQEAVWFNICECYILFLIASASRTVTQRHLKKRWRTTKDAEVFYFKDSLPGPATSELQDTSQPVADNAEDCSESTPVEATQMYAPDMSSFSSLLNQLSGGDQLQILSSCLQGLS